MEKFKVDFQGGETRYGNSGCNYMLCNAIIDEDGDEIEVELYAEVSCDDYNDECTIENKYGETEFDVDKFDEISYPILKENIINQAKEYGISEEQLKFWWD